ncbi:MAG: energy transducer TonB, partial [Algicola sp.]|nr:energy transducer TonB [Algicola sp.]
ELVPPPPPPPPPVVPEEIEIVEDEKEIEETVIESTETDQEEEIVEVEEIEVEEVEEDIEVPFSVIENVPIFPGCENEKGNNAKKQCMSDKISKFVNRKFNTDLAGDLGLSGRQRINVIFKIDKTGNIIGVQARAPHPGLEKEAKRVINLLPKMKPGKQRGKAVTVPYSLPILFQVQD